MAHCLIVLTKQECDVSRVLNFPAIYYFITEMAVNSVPGWFLQTLNLNSTGASEKQSPYSVTGVVDAYQWSV